MYLVKKSDFFLYFNLKKFLPLLGVYPKHKAIYCWCKKP